MSAASPRRAATRLVAAAAMAALPATAFVVSPAARADDSSPGSQLAGINTSAVSTGVQVAPFTPNIVGAGNAAEGDLFQVSMPYASSNSSTGPMTQGLATPVYPGSTASGLGTALQTFAPTIPPQLVSLLNDPVLARSAFPPQLTAGPSGTDQPPGAGAIGVGTASTSSNQGGTQATATLNDTAPLGNGVAGPIVGVGSSTSSTSASVQA
ncbi:MAG: hypothetical protein ACR2KC_03970, partial [Acidimicrobiales bacterium]